MTSHRRLRLPDRGSRGRRWAAVRSSLLAGSLLIANWAGTLAPVPIARAQVAPTPANNPPVSPHQILVFTQRDFVSASGYAAVDRVVVSVIHPNGTVVSTGNDPGQWITPLDDPRAAPGSPFAGIVEVNHPGGACWFTATPDIRAGDRVRIDIVAGPRAGAADETTVANVTARQPVRVDASTIAIHGTAVASDGLTQIPIGTLEQRLVAGGDAFAVNGRRTLRATDAPVKPGDGLLTYDSPTATTWTATYTGLSPADVQRALGAESRIMWLGGAAAAGVEGTIYEIGAGVAAGPGAPCAAPLEKLPPPPGSELIVPSTPNGLVATVVGANTVHLTWNASTDNVGVTAYGLYRGGVPLLDIVNPDGSAPAPTFYDDFNVPPGTFDYTVDAADAIGNRSGQSTVATVTTTQQLAELPAGTTINEPPVAPVQIIAFPTRDFVSSSGFLATDRVTVQVLRYVDNPGRLVVVSTSSAQAPQADPRAGPNDPFAGIVEVNHPGGYCWEGNTPDIRVGDIIRTIAYNPDDSIRTVDQTTTASVVTQRPVEIRAASVGLNDGVVQVHGMAIDGVGNPLDLGTVESRFIANRDLFKLNGRRVLRAGGAGKDGTLSYDANDPSGVHWTATYSGLGQQDMDRIFGRNGFPGAEYRTLWLGKFPLAGVELTIFENSDAVANGPAAVGTCFSPPSEPFDLAAPSAPMLTATPSGANDVRLSWSGASDNVSIAGYGVYRDGVRIHNVGRVATTYLDLGVPAGSHTYTVDAADAATPTLAATAANLPLQSLPWGNRSVVSNAVSLGQADVLAPSMPQNVVATVTGIGTIQLTWSASTDDVGVTSYRVYRNDVAVTPDVAASATPSFTDDGLRIGTYTYSVEAADAANNRSARSATATANVTAETDISPPSRPTNLLAAVPDIHARDIRLSWTASTDNIAVTGYGVYRRNAFPANAAYTRIADLSGTGTSFADAGLPAGTYDYLVDAFDSAGNRSPQSLDARVAVANDTPTGQHSILPFMQRDFVSSTGYALNEGPVTVSVLRNSNAGTNLPAAWRVVGSSTSIMPVEDPATPGLGAVEVNHPGGGCWSDVTPDLRPGDIVRFTNDRLVPEQTTVANVTAQRVILKTFPSPGLANGVVQVRGTARDLAGNPLPVEQVESRLVANKDLFNLNGRRTLRAGGAGSDGTLSYDSAGSVQWTATYSGLDENDVFRAIGGTTSSGSVFVGAESRGLWLGRNPLTLSELTFYENSDGVAGGPSAGIAGCLSAPQETPVGSTSFNTTGVTFADTNVGSNSTLSQTVALTNNGGAPLTVTAVALVGMNPADFSISGSTNFANCVGTTAPGATCSITIAFKPTAAGLRSAGLDFQDNAANVSGFIPLTGKGITPPPPPTPAPLAPSAPGAIAQSFDVPASVVVNAPLANSTMAVNVSWGASTGNVTRYAVQQSTDGGATWTDAARQPTPRSTTGANPAATMVRLDLQLGTLLAPKGYQFRVQACDNSTPALCSVWVSGSKFNTIPVDDSITANIAYSGSWSTLNVPGAYGGTVRSSTSAGANAKILNKVTFTILGDVAWVSTLRPDGGQATVVVDGGPPQTIDLYSATLRPAQVVWHTTGLAPGQAHTVTVTVAATKNVASTSTRVDIDMVAWLK
jgi:hypothetical protein